MPNERRIDHTLRELVVLGNHLCMWAGRTPINHSENVELDNLLNAWDKALARLRGERKEIEHISL